MKWDTIAARGAAVVDRVGAMLLWFVLSLVLLALVLPLNPAKLGAYLWMMSKVAGTTIFNRCVARSRNSNCPV